MYAFMANLELEPDLMKTAYDGLGLQCPLTNDQHEGALIGYVTLSKVMIDSLVAWHILRRPIFSSLSYVPVNLRLRSLLPHWNLSG